MKREYRYALQRNAHKLQCPACGHNRCFVPYVLNDGTNDKIIDADRFGRCDREQHCGYHLYPSKTDWQVPRGWKPAVAVEREPSFIDEDIVRKTTNPNLYRMQTLYRFFAFRLNTEKVANAWKRYQVGTTMNGSTVWWQIDERGRVRAGKIMQYLPDGHRNKAHFGTWAHKVLGIEDFNLKQCIFGLNVAIESDCKEVAVVESEKTAVLMSIFDDTRTWVATGGAGNVQPEKFAPLLYAGKRIVALPDKGMAAKWIAKLGKIATINTSLETVESLNWVPDGADVLDVAEYYDFNPEKIRIAL